MFDRCLYFNTNHLSRVVGRIWSDAYSELSLAPAHAYLLRLVLDQPGLSQKEISNLLHLEKSTITRFVDKMVNQGYLIRVQQKAEQSTLIMPTDKAKAIEIRLNAIGDELYSRMQKIIDPEALVEMVKSIKSTAEKL